jgi:cytochrome c-type biogenesis protein CcmH/NrfF
MSRHRLALLSLVAAALLAPSPGAAALARASLPDVEDEVMCPVCGTPLNLAQSPQADRERAFIRALIARGATKEQIKRRLVAQYGPQVLATPRHSGFDLAAYLVPVLLGAAAVALLAVALALWLALLGPVLGHLETPTVGASFMLTVSTEGLAVLAATLAQDRWLLYAALAPFALGLAFYAFVLARFDLRQLLAGRGDHWVSGGALAISALAAGRIAVAARRFGVLVGTAKVVALAVWGVALLWLPGLIAAELIRPRLRYDVRRWSTVFPLGMYAACSFTVGALVDATALTRLATAWSWVAFAVWLMVLGATLWRVSEVARRQEL